MKLRDAGKPFSLANIRKASVPIILVQSVFLIGEIVYYQIRVAIVIVIGKVSSHSSVGLPVVVHGNLSCEASLFEGSVPSVVIQKLDHRVIGNEEIDMAIAVIICDRNSQALAGFRDSDFIGN